jgi:endonuclease G
VPNYLFKLVYDEDKNQAWAFWQENTNTSPAAAPISYGELVKRTGVEFLPGVKVDRLISTALQHRTAKP